MSSFPLFYHFPFISNEFHLISFLMPHFLIPHLIYDQLLPSLHCRMFCNPFPSHHIHLTPIPPIPSPLHHCYLIPSIDFPMILIAVLIYCSWFCTEFDAFGGQSCWTFSVIPTFRTGPPLWLPAHPLNGNYCRKNTLILLSLGKWLIRDEGQQRHRH